jgi:hypothetical protein
MLYTPKVKVIHQKEFNFGVVTSPGTCYVDIYGDVLNDGISPNTIQSASGARIPGLSDKWLMTVGRGCYAPPLHLIQRTRISSPLFA